MRRLVHRVSKRAGTVTELLVLPTSQVSASGQHGHVTSGMATPSVAAPNAPLRVIQLIYDRISEPRAISLHAKEFYVGCVCDGTLWQQWRREKRRGAFGGGVVLSVRQAAQCQRAGFCVCTLGLRVQACPDFHGASPPLKPFVISEWLLPTSEGTKGHWVLEAFRVRAHRIR